MKKKNLFMITIASIIIAAMSACTSDESDDIQATNGQTVTFTGDFIDSKSSLASDGGVLWSAGDKIGVFAGTSSNAEFSITSGTNKGPGFESADFNGTIAGYTPGTTAYAYYPYKSDVSMSGTVISGIELPQTQTYKENTFDTNVAPAAATSTNLLLPFKNLCGIIKIQLTGSASISTITFSGGNKYVAGTGSVDMANISAGFVPDAAQYKTVTLQCPTPQQLSSTAKTFYILVPPQSYEGIKLVIQSSNGDIMTKASKNTLTVKRSAIVSLGTIDFKPDSDTQDYMRVPNSTQDWNTATAPKVFKFDDGYEGFIYMPASGNVDFKFYTTTNEWRSGNIWGDKRIWVANSDEGGNYSGTGGIYHFWQIKPGENSGYFEVWQKLSVVGKFEGWTTSGVQMTGDVSTNSFSATVTFTDNGNADDLAFLIIADGNYISKFGGSVTDIAMGGDNLYAPGFGTYKVTIHFNAYPRTVTFEKQ